MKIQILWQNMMNEERHRILHDFVVILIECRGHDILSYEDAGQCRISNVILDSLG